MKHHNFKTPLNTTQISVINFADTSLNNHKNKILTKGLNFSVNP